MDRRNDPLPPGSPWRVRPAARSGADPQRAAATLATPVTWMGGSLLLTATTFLVSSIALIRAIVSLFD